MCDGSTSGLVACNNKQDEERSELLCSQTLSVNFSVHHHRSDVIARVLQSVFTECQCVSKNLSANTDEVFQSSHELWVANTKDGVGPVEDHLFIRFRNAHHVADDLQRHQSSNFVHEVALLLGETFEHAVDYSCGTNSHRLFECGDLFRSEPLRNNGAQTEMLGVIHVDHGAEEFVDLLWQVSNV